MLVFLWMIVIFLFSSMDATESNTKSKGTIDKVIDETIKEAEKAGFDQKITEEKKKEVVEKLNLPLRKIMHAGVYFVLSLLIINALIISNFKIFFAFFLTLILSFTYACTDEYHQTLVEGRTGQFLDVVIDLSGAFIGASVYGIGYTIYKKKKVQYENN